MKYCVKGGTCLDAVHVWLRKQIESTVCCSHEFVQSTLALAPGVDSDDKQVRPLNESGV